MLGGILGGPVGMTGYYLAVKYIGAGHAATISSLYPAIGAVLAFIFLKEKIGKRGWFGLVLAILGIGLSSFSNYVRRKNKPSRNCFCFINCSWLGFRMCNMCLWYEG